MSMTLTPSISVEHDVLDALAPTAESLMARHLERTKEWFPHEHVPWSRGRDFEPGEASDTNGADLPEGVRSAIIINLLTEDNLPYYTQTIGRRVSIEGVWGRWTRRWTAEEDRHSTVLRDYLCVSRLVDLRELERLRMIQLQNGYEASHAPTPLNLFVYLTLQELATRISHRNTGAALTDAAGTDVMSRVAADENLHFLFYRDLATKAIELFPDDMVIAMERQVKDFAMPGYGLPDFSGHARRIAAAGIYNIPIHVKRILEPTVIRDWGLESLELTTAEGAEARDRLMTHLGKLRRIADRLVERGEPLEPVNSAAA